MRPRFVDTTRSARRHALASSRPSSRAPSSRLTRQACSGTGRTTRSPRVSGHGAGRPSIHDVQITLNTQPSP
jgi:hypothetical protein